MRWPLCDRSTTIAAIVEPLDDFATERREPGIARRHRSAADAVQAVIGQLHDAEAEIGESVDPFGLVAEHVRVLHAVDHADPVPSLGVADILRRPDLGKRGGVVPDESVVTPDIRDAGSKSSALRLVFIAVRPDCRPARIPPGLIIVRGSRSSSGRTADHSGSSRPPRLLTIVIRRMSTRPRALAGRR
jgi:hypothetical protein